jgi:hypothetical protein
MNAGESLLRLVLVFPELAILLVLAAAAVLIWLFMLPVRAVEDIVDQPRVPGRRRAWWPPRRRSRK